MTSRATRAAGALLVAGAVAAISVPASGSDPPLAPRTGATPSFATLPEGHVPDLPGAAPPERIAASEKVPGLTGEPMPADQLRQMRLSGQSTRYSYLFADPVQARAFAKSTNGSADSKADVCLVDGGNAETLKSSRGDEDGPHDWPSSFSSMIAFQFETDLAGSVRRMFGRARRLRARTSAGGEVHAVHAERFVAGPEGRASLEVTDAWFDPRTRGTRLIGRSTLPLSRALVGPNGLEVYAARDGEAVQIVLHVPEHPSDDAALDDQLLARMRNLAVTMPDLGGGNTDCGHLRVTLRATAGVGQMATLQSTAFLPPADGDWGQPSDGESSDSRGQRMFQAMRQRPYQLTVSATASSADKSPVLSIALGWNGREQRGG